MKILPYLFFVLFSVYSLEAAAPATHIYFAQVWMEKYPIDNPSNQALFLIGNLFPDIRYLGTIDRDSTHDHGVTPSKIDKTACPFRAGMKLHSFVDEKRAKFVKFSKINSYLKHIPKKTRVLFLKLLEDEIYWDRVEKIPVQEAVLDIYPEEINFGVHPAVVKEWHNILTDYFTIRPSLLLKQLVEEGKGYLKADAKTVIIWDRYLSTHAEQSLFISYSEDLLRYLDRSFGTKTN